MTETELQTFLARMADDESEDVALVEAIRVVRRYVMTTRDTLGHAFQIAAAMETALMQYVQTHTEGQP